MPGVIEEMLEGEVEGMKLGDGTAYMLSTYFVVPLVMAVLTLLVSDRVSRYGNLVAGSLIGIVLLLGIAADIAAVGFDAHLLVSTLGALIALVIGATSLAEVRKAHPPGQDAPVAESEKLHAGVH